MKMRITELLDKRSIALDGAPKNKSEALDQVVELMIKSGKIRDKEAYRAQVYEREEESTTGIGEGIAIPHGRGDSVIRPGLAAMVVRDGVDFDSLDGEKVTLIFLIAAPNTKDNVHLDVLSKLSVLMMDETFSNNLRNAKSVDEFLAIIDKADEEQESIDERLAGTGAAVSGQARILAVTSCPTGIAHTYMAAEGIEKAAKERNCAVKIETRGSGGAKNVLTAQEIEEASCIIVAADAQVPMDRFEGKKVIECQVSDGISKAGELLDRAISGDVPVYHAVSGGNVPAQRAKKSGGAGGIEKKGPVSRSPCFGSLFFPLEIRPDDLFQFLDGIGLIGVGFEYLNEVVHGGFLEDDDLTFCLHLDPLALFPRNIRIEQLLQVSDGIFLICIGGSILLVFLQYPEQVVNSGFLKGDHFSFRRHSCSSFKYLGFFLTILLYHK